VFLYVPVVLLWCRDRGLGDAQAEDAACEVFHAVAARLGEFTPGHVQGGFRAWLRGLACEHLNEHPVPPEEPREVARTESALPAEDAGLERWLLYRRGLELFGADLEPRQWDAARRVLLEQEPAESVAASLDISVAGVLTAKARLLCRLREEMRSLDE
jgi:hypothetical protein